MGEVHVDDFELEVGFQFYVNIACFYSIYFAIN